MEYSKENVMSRKEYLKSKQSLKYVLFGKFKYILVVLVIILLGIYVFKQLNVYNNVTKIANKVVEESALTKTMKMYYVSEPYTKDNTTVVMLYKAVDESRTKIEGSENLSNILMVGDKLYGIDGSKLFQIDTLTYEKKQVMVESISNYMFIGDRLFVYICSNTKKDTGIYEVNTETREIKQIIQGTVYQMASDGKYIYIVGPGKTNKSIIRYLLNGSNRTQITDKQIVSRIVLNGDNIYFTNESEGNALYSVSKSGKNITRRSEGKIYISNNTKKDLVGENSYAIKEGFIYYINSSKDNTLYSINMTNGKEKQLVNKRVDTLQLEGNSIYFKPADSIGMYKYNLESGKSEQVTNARTNEYICFKQ